ncbi:MAG: hypothetical protein ABIH99_06115, partial [Candidatus Micrarchaeota archaeon]
KYKKLKSKLLGEIVDELKRKKKVVSLFELAAKFPRERPVKEKTVEKGNVAPINEAFKKTYKLIFGKEANGGMAAYKEYVLKHTLPVIVLEETASSGELPVLKFLSKLFPKQRMISYRDSATLSKNPRRLSEKEAEEVSISNPNALSKVLFIPGNHRMGNCENVTKAESAGFGAVDCYYGGAFHGAKLCAYCWWPRNSSYMFGCSSTLTSSFCMNCYNSKKLARCFELDSCENCSDVYFAHNCENVHDSMFCFNAKNLRNAVGNAEVGKGKYAKLKSSLLAQISGELNKKKKLKWDVYNIGCTIGNAQFPMRIRAACSNCGKK